MRIGLIQRLNCVTWQTAIAMGGLSVSLSAGMPNPAYAGDADQYSTSCGTFTASELQGNNSVAGPAASIDLPASGVNGNYALALNLNGCTGAVGPAGPAGANGANGAAGPAGPAGPIGPQGLTGATGATGLQGTTGATGANGTNGTNGANGVNGANGAKGATGGKGDKGDQGKDGKDGINGRDFDLEKSLALNAALSLPAWLEHGEQFSLTGGIGFAAGGDTAIGVTGIVRMEGSAAGFVGGAVSSSGDTWVGKAGMRVGF